ncbi:MAG: hypothetical protein ACI883_000525, partial [Candidatus Azotimanducaceae bacterium]
CKTHSFPTRRSSDPISLVRLIDRVMHTLIGEEKDD